MVSRRPEVQDSPLAFALTRAAHAQHPGLRHTAPPKRGGTVPLRPGERQQQLSAALAAGTAPRVSVRSLSPWQLLQAGWGGKGEKLQEENATRRSGSPVPLPPAPAPSPAWGPALRKSLDYNHSHQRPSNASSNSQHASNTLH